MSTMQSTGEASWRDRLFALLQLVLPTRWLSLLVHRIAGIRHDGFKNLLIQLFMRGYTIDLNEAEFVIPQNYESFNHFFTRALKPGARPLPEDPLAFVSPVDGTVSQCGEIRDGRIFQAKGHSYSVLELLGGDAAAAERFAQGRFCTIYLAPYNYHRIHMPFAGQLQQWSYVPGRLFSVNAATARAMPNLFARNERLNALFEHAGGGQFGLTLVGALFVGSLETVWSGRVSPPHLRGEPMHYETMTPVLLDRGDELGRFNMGSTVILLAAPGVLEWSPELTPGHVVRMGEAIGRWSAIADRA
jgi:phosphatidylserine decarboxylase